MCGLDVWLDPVSSKLNIADRPTRSNEELPYETLKVAPYKEPLWAPEMAQQDPRNRSSGDDFVKVRH